MIKMQHQHPQSLLIMEIKVYIQAQETLILDKSIGNQIHGIDIINVISTIPKIFRPHKIGQVVRLLDCIENVVVALATITAVRGTSCIQNRL